MATFGKHFFGENSNNNAFFEISYPALVYKRNLMEFRFHQKLFLKCAFHSLKIFCFNIKASIY